MINKKEKTKRGHKREVYSGQLPNQIANNNKRRRHENPQVEKRGKEAKEFKQGFLRREK